MFIPPGLVGFQLLGMVGCGKLGHQNILVYSTRIGWLPATRHGCVVGSGEPGHQRSLPETSDRSTHMRHIQLHDGTVSRLQHDSHPHVYRVRIQDSQDSGELQRS